MQFHSCNEPTPELTLTLNVFHALSFPQYGTEDAAYRKPAPQHNVVQSGGPFQQENPQPRPMPAAGRAPQLIRKSAAAYQGQPLAAQEARQLPSQLQLAHQQQQFQPFPFHPPPLQPQPNVQPHQQPRPIVVSPTPQMMMPMQLAIPMQLPPPVCVAPSPASAHPHFLPPGRHVSQPQQQQPRLPDADLRPGVLGQGTVVSTSAFEDLGYQIDSSGGNQRRVPSSSGNPTIPLSCARACLSEGACVRSCYHTQQATSPTRKSCRA